MHGIGVKRYIYDYWYSYKIKEYMKMATFLIKFVVKSILFFDFFLLAAIHASLIVTLHMFWKCAMSWLNLYWQKKFLDVISDSRLRIQKKN